MLPVLFVSVRVKRKKWLITALIALILYENEPQNFNNLLAEVLIGETFSLGVFVLVKTMNL